MSARDRILARLRQSAPSQAPLAPASSPAGTYLAGEASQAALPRFVACLEAAHAQVVDARNGPWAARVVEFCRQRDLRRLWIPGGRFPALHVGDDCGVERFDNPIETCKDSLFTEVDVGLTVADCGIADTGMLVHRSAPVQPRTLSLVPPLHCCLININRLYGNLASALSGESWGDKLPSNLIFISGPSKTADIQQTLAYGAHGPKELVVFLIDEDVPLSAPARPPEGGAQPPSGRMSRSDRRAAQ